MSFSFFSEFQQCNEITFVTFCQTGWHLRYQEVNGFLDSISLNNFPDAFDGFCIAIDNGRLTDKVINKGLELFLAWIKVIQ